MFLTAATQELQFIKEDESCASKPSLGLNDPEPFSSYDNVNSSIKCDGLSILQQPP